MAFGKRHSPPAQREGAPARPSALVPQHAAAATPAERWSTWTETMQRIFGQMSAIAAAMREDGTFEVRGMDTEVHPETTPIDIMGLDENFTILEAGKPLHPVYGYVLASSPSQVDQSAQVHLHQLVARIMELNLFCQRAVRDGALGVALQSPKLPPLVDRVLVGSAFFVAYFENLALTQPMLLAGESAGSPLINHGKLAASLERRRLMAVDRMLAPATFDELLPFRRLPFIPVETAMKPHAGQKFVNGVYFPVGMTPAPIGPGIRASSANAA